MFKKILSALISLVMMLTMLVFDVSALESPCSITESGTNNSLKFLWSSATFKNAPDDLAIITNTLTNGEKYEQAKTAIERLVDKYKVLDIKIVKEGNSEAFNLEEYRVLQNQSVYFNCFYSTKKPENYDSRYLQGYKIKTDGTYEALPISEYSNDEIRFGYSGEGVYIIAQRKMSNQPDNLHNGIYEVPIDAWNYTADQPSMANGALSSPAKLIVTDEGQKLYFTIHPMVLEGTGIEGHLEKMWYFDSLEKLNQYQSDPITYRDNRKEVKVESTYSIGARVYPGNLSIDLNTDKPIVYMQVQVDAMGASRPYVKIRLHYDYMETINWALNDGLYEVPFEIYRNKDDTTPLTTAIYVNYYNDLEVKVEVVDGKFKIYYTLASYDRIDSNGNYTARGYIGEMRYTDENGNQYPGIVESTRTVYTLAGKPYELPAVISFTGLPSFPKKIQISSYKVTMRLNADGTDSISNSPPEWLYHIIRYDQVNTSTATPTATPTAISTVAPTATSTPTLTATSTATPTVTPIPTSTATRAASPTTASYSGQSLTTVETPTPTSTSTLSPTPTPPPTLRPTAAEEPDEKIPAAVPGQHKAYIKGYPDGSFRPAKNITRAEAAVIIANLLEEGENSGYNTSYKDMDSSHWAAQAVGLATEEGILKGYSDNSFKPDRSMTRAEFATAVFRLLQKMKGLGATEAFESSLTDVKGHWAENYIERLAILGCIKGYPDGTFKPESTINRAEGVTLINRSLERGPLYGAEEQLFKDVGKSHWAFFDISEAAIEHDRTADGLEP